MVYPGSQVQWVVPCVIVQRDGRTEGPLVAAGKVEAAAVAEEVAAEVFVMVTKTERREQEGGKVSCCSVLIPCCNIFSAVDFYGFIHLYIHRHC